MTYWGGHFLELKVSVGPWASACAEKGGLRHEGNTEFRLHRRTRRNH